METAVLTGSLIFCSFCELRMLSADLLFWEMWISAAPDSWFILDVHQKFWFTPWTTTYLSWIVVTSVKVISHSKTKWTCACDFVCILQSSHWVATVLLNCCKVIERPSKKDGFCFKVFHPLEQSIWAAKGPEGEAIGAVVQPLPTTYLICRAPSADQGKCWMDGLELALT